MKTKIITYASVVILVLCLAAAWFNRGAEQPDKAKPGALTATDVGPARLRVSPDEDVTPVKTEMPAMADQSVLENTWAANDQDGDLFMVGRKQEQLALENKRDVNKRDEFGATALHTAVAGEDRAAVKALLEGGADVNLPDAEGNTALIIAVEKNDIKLVRLLLKAGADVTVRNLYGDTPLLTAVWAEQVEIAELLLKVGADPRVKNHDDQTPLMLLQ